MTRGKPLIRSYEGERLVARQCSLCREVIPAEKFYNKPSAKDGLSERCRACVAFEAAKSQKARPLDRRYNALKHRYGLSRVGYEELFRKQGGVCAICGDPPPEGRFLYVDHDHGCCKQRRTCGNCVRGLLCNDCNNGIGRFKDDPVRLLKAAKYLQERKVA